MGDYSDDIENGVICEICQCIIDGEEPGYTRRCDDCGKYEEDQ